MHIYSIALINSISTIDLNVVRLPLELSNQVTGPAWLVGPNCKMGLGRAGPYIVQDTYFIAQSSLKYTELFTKKLLKVLKKKAHKMRAQPIPVGQSGRVKVAQFILGLWLKSSAQPKILAQGTGSKLTTLGTIPDEFCCNTICAD